MILGNRKEYLDIMCQRYQEANRAERTANLPCGKRLRGMIPLWVKGKEAGIRRPSSASLLFTLHLFPILPFHPFTFSPFRLFTYSRIHDKSESSAV